MTKRLSRKLDALVNQVRRTASKMEVPGGVDETTRWGQISFVPKKPRIGTTVRVDQHDDEHVAVYVHCQTNLIETFRTVFPHLNYSGNRAILFRIDEALPKDEIRACVEAALLYHANKRNTAHAKRPTHA